MRSQAGTRWMSGACLEHVVYPLPTWSVSPRYCRTESGRRNILVYRTVLYLPSTSPLGFSAPACTINRQKGNNHTRLPRMPGAAHVRRMYRRIRVGRTAQNPPSEHHQSDILSRNRNEFPNKCMLQLWLLVQQKHGKPGDRAVACSHVQSSAVDRLYCTCRPTVSTAIKTS